MDATERAGHLLAARLALALDDAAAELTSLEEIARRVRAALCEGGALPPAGTVLSETATRADAHLAEVRQLRELLAEMDRMPPKE